MKCLNDNEFASRYSRIFALALGKVALACLSENSLVRRVRWRIIRSEWSSSANCVNSPLGIQSSKEKEMGRGENFRTLTIGPGFLHSVRWIFIVDLFRRKDVSPPENLKRQPGVLYSIALREINLAGCVACKIPSVFRRLMSFYAITDRGLYRSAGNYFAWRYLTIINTRKQ